MSFIGAYRKILRSQFFIEFTVNKSLVPDFRNLTIHTRTTNLVVMWIRRNPWGMVQYVLCTVVKHIAVKCSVLQCVAVCVAECVAVCIAICVAHRALWCSIVQCTLQCGAEYMVVVESMWTCRNSQKTARY